MLHPPFATNTKSFCFPFTPAAKQSQTYALGVEALGVLHFDGPQDQRSRLHRTVFTLYDYHAFLLPYHMCPILVRRRYLLAGLCVRRD